MPKTRRGARRIAASSSVYGTTEASTAMPSAMSIRCGRPVTCQAPRAPNGATASAPTVIPTARPPRPGTAALTRDPATMYSAQNAAETSTSATPAASSGCPERPA